MVRTDLAKILLGQMPPFSNKFEIQTVEEVVHLRRLFLLRTVALLTRASNLSAVCAQSLSLNAHTHFLVLNVNRSVTKYLS